MWDIYLCGYGLCIRHNKFRFTGVGGRCARACQQNNTPNTQNSHSGAHRTHRPTVRKIIGGTHCYSIGPRQLLRCEECVRCLFYSNSSVCIAAAVVVAPCLLFLVFVVVTLLVRCIQSSLVGKWSSVDVWLLPGYSISLYIFMRFLYVCVCVRSFSGGKQKFFRFLTCVRMRSYILSVVECLFVCYLICFCLDTCEFSSIVSLVFDWTPFVSTGKLFIYRPIVKHFYTQFVCKIVGFSVSFSVCAAPLCSSAKTTH